MSGEAEVTGRSCPAWMGGIAHGFSDFGEIAVEDHVAVELDADGGSAHGNFLEVPCTNRALKTSLRWKHAVSRSVILARVEFGVLRSGVVEYLKFAHGVL